MTALDMQDNWVDMRWMTTISKAVMCSNEKLRQGTLVIHFKEKIMNKKRSLSISEDN